MVLAGGLTNRVSISKDEDPHLVDLFRQILDKDPETRIKMPTLREHPWVTADGEDSLLSTEENTAEMVTHVSEKDYADAIKGIRGVMHVVRAVNKLKALRQNSLNNQQGEGHRHTKSLEIERTSLLLPNSHPIRKFLHDHLTVQSPSEEKEQEHLSLPPSMDPENPQEEGHRDPPLTPKIQVLAPPDEPSSEDEIQYIGVGLGTLSTLDKRRRQPGKHALTEPAPTLHTRSSSESIRSDTSATSGQLTPKEAMVYASPSITHENVFEAAFQRAEDKIRLTMGDDAMIYNTWRSEDIRGQPVTNRYGREKVELENIDEDEDGRPRWERVMMEKFPQKLAELYSRKGERMDVLRETKDMLGDEAAKRWEWVKGVKDAVMNDPDAQPGNPPPEKREKSAGARGWDKILGRRAHGSIGAVKDMVDSLGNKVMGTEEQQDMTKHDTTAQDVTTQNTTTESKDS
jgi:hypothetical protein